MARNKPTPTRTAQVSLMGGLNMVTPPLTTPDGSLLDVLNFFPSLDSGYTRIYGYCRYDGQEEPWRRNVAGLYMDDLSYFAIGETLTADNGATGIIVYTNVKERVVLLANYTPGFQGATTVTNGTHTEEIIEASVPYGVSLAQEKETVETWYRNRIQQPAGSGAITGLAYGLHNLFAFREDAGRIRAFKASSDSWQELPFHHVMRYRKGGHNLPKEGDSFTASSGGTCTVLKTVRNAGSMDDNSAAGYCLLDAVTGTIAAGDELQSGEFSAGSLDGVNYRLLTARGTADLKLYPAVGDTVKSEEGITAVVAEAISTEAIDPKNIRIFILVKTVVGSMTKGQTLKHRPTGATEDVEIGTLESDAETVWRLVPADTGKLPYRGDKLVLGSASGSVEQRLSIKNGEETHEFLRLRDIAGTIANNAEVTVKVIAGCASEAPWLFSLTPGAVFQFTEHNFYGAINKKRIYGCNGVDPAFEFDGECFMPILMTSAEDENNPVAIAAHKGHLFLGLPGGKVRHSVVGQPLNFSGQLGAFELGAGDVVTALHTTEGGTLLIGCRNKLYMLYGNTVKDWQLDLVATNAGALPHTVQSIGKTLALDDVGIIQLDRVEAFGDFEFATVSRLIQPLLVELKGLSIGSAVIRDYNQLRYYFSNGLALAVKPEAEGPPSITRLIYPVESSCVCHGEDARGNPVVFFGTKDGWVYQDNVGTNFDGDPIQAYFQTSYSHLGTPAVRKSYKRIELDFSGEYGTKVYISAEIDYSEAHVPTIRANTVDITGGGGYWGISNWNEFYWSANTVNSGGIPVTGTGRNISMLVTGEHTWQEPYTIYGFYIHYIPRRLHRG